MNIEKLSEDWKIPLDCKSERNVTKCCPIEHAFYSFEKQSCSTLNLWPQNQPPLVNYMPTTRQLEIQNSMFLDASRRQFFPDFLRAQTWFELSRVKLYRNDRRGKKLLWVSGRFELSRVRVTEGKITVHVWQILAATEPAKITIIIITQFNEVSHKRIIIIIILKTSKRNISNLIYLSLKTLVLFFLQNFKPLWVPGK